MQAPKLPSPFRNVRMSPKGFKFSPRYYDPKKEALEKRIRLIEAEVAVEDREAEKAKARMEHSFQNRKSLRAENPHMDKGRGLRLFIILGLLLALGRVAYRYLEL